MLEAHLNDPVHRSFELRHEESNPGKKIERSGHRKFFDPFLTQPLNLDPLWVVFTIAERKWNRF
jgi:hypothetical protein